MTTVSAGRRSGCVTIPASKSAAHRLLICAALSRSSTTLILNGMSKDISATMKCLTGLGASFDQDNDRMAISSILSNRNTDCIDTIQSQNASNSTYADLYCGESGSTLRFLLPLCGALGAKVVFHMEGLLSKRPMDIFIQELTAHGMIIRQDNELLYAEGCLKPGDYTIPGNISSQYISGLLFSLPLLSGNSTLKVTGKLESESYINMTENAIQKAGIRFDRTRIHSEECPLSYRIPGNQVYAFPEELQVERDWSNAAFFLCMGALSPAGITLYGMDTNSGQGDRKILDILRDFGAEISILEDRIMIRRGKLTGHVIDAADTPDLVPTICALAAGADGTTQIIHAERLRFKESDRIASTVNMIRDLGGIAEPTEDGLIITGQSSISGGTINPENDHRIAMAAAVAASICTGDVNIPGAECAQKSYPGFWDDLDKLEVIS